MVKIKGSFARKFSQHICLNKLKYFKYDSKKIMDNINVMNFKKLENLF